MSLRKITSDLVEYRDAGSLDVQIDAHERSVGLFQTRDAVASFSAFARRAVIVELPGAPAAEACAAGGGSTASECALPAGLVETAVNLTIVRAADSGGDAGAGPRSGGLRERVRTRSQDPADDGITRALLADAACRAAARLAAIRRLDAPDDPRAVDAARLAQRLPVAREEAGR